MGNRGPQVVDGEVLIHALVGLDDGLHRAVAHRMHGKLKAVLEGQPRQLV